jgi:hypothetical protein
MILEGWYFHFSTEQLFFNSMYYTLQFILPDHMIVLPILVVKT